ncbi:hypothetical protein [Microlunatus antarcticus]|uniref:Uncharacterized protein n=1 Tax=Microlunatus antarcticus TaxID=53388 RepID=A0A7W5P6C1_9ACTN|nr:hypothetical protein [Microlunatus antarcticus]MBB3326227.1 hypothetical protein [Microlunatus antarcticus]
MHQAWRHVLGRRQEVGGSPTELEDGGAEELVSAFFTSYATAAGSRGLGVLEQLPRSVRALRAARSLPVLTIDVSDSIEGRVIRQGLAHFGRRTLKTAFIRTPLHEVASVLILPKTPKQYAEGRSKQTLRRKTRAAERAGVRWEPVDDVAERRRLVALSESRERIHPQERYRSADVDNSRLLDHRLWLVAYSRDDVPLLMAVVPTDGAWSMLAYFRTLEDSTDASNARYLMSSVLAEALVARGVRYLVDTATMSNLPEGLRHFQRMLGYRVVRVRLSAALRRRQQPPDSEVSAAPPASGSGSASPSPVEVDRSGTETTSVGASSVQVETARART